MTGGARGKFDPSKMLFSRGERAGGDGRLTVSQLASLIDDAVRGVTPKAVSVVGEVSQFTERTHWYFSLKDEQAVVSCMVFASRARRIARAPSVGERIVVSGRLEFFAPQGRVQLYVTSIERVGAGAAQEALRQAVEHARAAGWLDDDRKRMPPLLPRWVAVITSETGAAWRDVEVTVRRRCPSIRLDLRDTRVQGEQAPGQIARAIRRAGETAAAEGIDAIIVTRGGGSPEDLWAFNDEDVARAIVESSVPVVCAIGHETDTTLAELVADVRASTPTQAAMKVAPDADALRQQLDALGIRLERSVMTLTGRARDHVASIERRAGLDTTRSVLAPKRAGIESAGVRLRHAIGERLRSAGRRAERLARLLEERRPERAHSRREREASNASRRLGQAMLRRLAPQRALVESAERSLERAFERRAHDEQASMRTLAARLASLDPAAVLSRGYSVTRDADGRVVRRPSDVRAGAEVTTRLAHGQIRSRVVSDRSPRRARSEPEDPQLDLFTGDG